jgi:hypothetical protein
MMACFFEVFLRALCVSVVKMDLTEGNEEKMTRALVRRLTNRADSCNSCQNSEVPFPLSAFNFLLCRCG